MGIRIHPTVVDDAGVFAMEFSQPHEVTEIVTERAEILPLEEAVASFERMIGYQYAAYETGQRELATTHTSASMKSGSG